MTLDEVVKANGRPISFLNFYIENSGGIVVNFNNDPFAGKEVQIQLCPDKGAYDSTTAADPANSSDQIDVRSWKCYVNGHLCGQ